MAFTVSAKLGPGYGTSPVSPGLWNLASVHRTMSFVAPSLKLACCPAGISASG